MVFLLCRGWELYFSNSLNLDWHWLYFLNAFKNFSESRVLSIASYLTVTSCIVTLQSMRELNPPSSHWQCDMLNLYTNRLFVMGRGFEPLSARLKTLCTNHYTNPPFWLSYLHRPDSPIFNNHETKKNSTFKSTPLRTRTLSKTLEESCASITPTGHL